MRSRELWFVVPDPGAFVSGGNRYNAALLAELGPAGWRCAALEPGEASRRLASSTPGACFVDSLHLDAVPELAGLARGRTPLALLAHYLPSLVGVNHPAEHRALPLLAGACAPSDFMREELLRRGLDPARVFVAEPGQRCTLAPALPDPAAGVRAVCAGSLIESKGVLALLEALAVTLTDADRFDLVVAGSLDADPAYAERCRQLVAASPALRARVTFLGTLDGAAFFDEVQRANLVVSASAMESFGMVLAEARVLGVPLLARTGGNTARHVAPGAGGELVATAAELAAACLRLGRDPDEHRRRLDQARARAPAPRSWAAVARDFARGAQALIDAYE